MLSQKENKKIYVVCCLYNKLISEICFLAELLNLNKEINNFRIIILDNSTDEVTLIQNKKIYYEMKNEIIYFCNKGNIGISKSYNIAIQYIRKVDSSEWVIMFADDDTQFSKEYLKNAVLEINRGEKIVSGLICEQNGKVVGPYKKYSTFRKERIKKTGKYENIYCINSGLFLTKDIINIIGPFDERIFVDMVDFWLMDELIKRDINKINIVKGNILQNFSGKSDDYKKYKKRNQTFYKDVYTYCEIENKSFLFKYILILNRKAHTWLKRR